MLLAVLLVILAIEVIVLVTNPAPLKEQLKVSTAAATARGTPDHPLIVLYKGKSSKHDYIWTTGHWAGWGSGKSLFCPLKKPNLTAMSRVPQHGLLHHS